VKKCGTIRRRAGLLFVRTMFVTGASASILGFRKSPTDSNVFAGLMDPLFCRHGADDCPPVSPWTRRIHFAMLGTQSGWIGHSNG